MRNLIPKFLKFLKRSNDGGSMVEYALLIAVVAFGATAGMKDMAAKERSGLEAMGSAIDQIAQGNVPTGCFGGGGGSNPFGPPGGGGGGGGGGRGGGPRG